MTGWQLDSHYRLVNQYRAATDGNVVQTAEIDATPGRPFSLALGFGPGARAASRAALASATTPFGRTLAGYVSGLAPVRPHAPPRHLAARPFARAGARMRAMYWLSATC